MKKIKILQALALAFVVCGSVRAQEEKKTKNEPTELDIITRENKLSEQENKKKIIPLVNETEKLKAEYELMLQKNKNELAETELRFKKLSLENNLAKEEFKKELERLSRENAKLKLENEKTLEQIKADNARKSERIKLEKKRISLELERLRLEKEKIAQEVAKLDIKLDERAKKEKWKDEVNKDPDYREEPFVNGTLVISDRRISLNGPIVFGVADYIADRIHYYNNKSHEQPIFLVIDKSPGGSVMEGYRIIKAIEASKAPVYVVVKSYAASMAAIITTLAERSFAYPNAFLMHHQMSTMNWGNIRELEERLEMAKEWEKRLLVPVAKKMGITLKKFKKKMYENNSEGNWEEFADDAVKLKWVNKIADEIRETGILKNPDKYSFSKSPVNFEEKTDKDGKRYVQLPRLEPFDFYFIYNPDSYYR